MWDGLRQRPARRTVLAGAIVLSESAIYASNNQVCPLAPLAEELGASRGSAADIFLPDWLSGRIPLFGGTAFLLGVGLSVAGWLRQRLLRGTSHMAGLPAGRVFT